MFPKISIPNNLLLFRIEYIKKKFSSLRLCFFDIRLEKYSSFLIYLFYERYTGEKLTYLVLEAKVL